MSNSCTATAASARPIRAPEMAFRGYIFGHYDSRGGAFLIRASNMLAALTKYLDTFGVDPVRGPAAEEEHLFTAFAADGTKVFVAPDPAHSLIDYTGCSTPREAAQRLVDQQIDELCSDFIRAARCVFFDEAPPAGPAELDEDYDEGGFRYGVVQSRRAGSTTWSEHEDMRIGKVMVFWKGRKPSPADVVRLVDNRHGTHEFRLVREELGEDAGGLWLSD